MARIGGDSTRFEVGWWSRDSCILGEGRGFGIRLPAERTPDVLALSGKPLRLGPHTIRLAAPSVTALGPAARLKARSVTIRGYEQPAPFAVRAETMLHDLGVSGRLLRGTQTGGAHSRA